MEDFETRYQHDPEIQKHPFEGVYNSQDEAGEGSAEELQQHRYLFLQNTHVPRQVIMRQFLKFQCLRQDPQLFCPQYLLSSMRPTIQWKQSLNQWDIAPISILVFQKQGVWIIELRVVFL